MYTRGSREFYEHVDPTSLFWRHPATQVDSDMIFNGRTLGTQPKRHHVSWHPGITVLFAYDVYPACTQMLYKLLMGYNACKCWLLVCLFVRLLMYLCNLCCCCCFLCLPFFNSKKFVFFLKISAPQDLTQNDFGHGGMTLAQAPARFRLKTSPGELDPYH